MADVLVLNGPNLNLLGTREPEVYGATSLRDLEERCVAEGTKLGLSVSCAQFNGEGDLVTAVQEAGRAQKWVIFNPGAYTHTSIALRDAISGSGCRVIEVHISNVHARETFRHHSHISPVAEGTIVGLGVDGYTLALHAVALRTPR
ncbi:MAG: type II 3-dehydroquinate dehydratase [Pseudomonadota bacterium]